MLPKGFLDALKRGKAQFHLEQMMAELAERYLIVKKQIFDENLESLYEIDEIPERQFQTVWEQIGGGLVPSNQYEKGTLERIFERRLADLLYYQTLDLADFISAVLNDMEEEGYV